MKVTAMLILMALSVSILASFSISPCRHKRRPDDHAHIITLDVCKTSGSSTPVKAKAPAIKEAIYNLFSSAFSGYIQIIHPQNKPSLIAFQLKHPPRS